MSTKIDGRAAAREVRAEIAQEVASLAERSVVPALATVQVGADPASAAYVRNLKKTATTLGISVTEHHLESDTSQVSLAILIEQLNADPAVHGILMHLPLPPHIDPDAIVNTIDPAKDIDGVTVLNAGRLYSGHPTFVPSTPLACLLLLRPLFPEGMSGKRAVVVGRSTIVGKPMAALLLQENCTVTLAHSRTREIEALCREAEILVVAVGRPRLVTREWVQPGAVVIDVGINSIEEAGERRLVGDVDYDDVVDTVGAITPVPGGVGPMTVAALLRNTVRATRGGSR